MPAHHYHYHVRIVFLPFQLNGFWVFAAEAPCYLLRLHGDPMLTGCLAYVITGSRILGSSGDIFLQAEGTEGEFVVFKFQSLRNNMK